MPVRVFPELADALSDEPALVELFTGLTSDEVDALAMEDFESNFFCNMATRRPRRAPLCERVYSTYKKSFSIEKLLE